MFRAHQRRLRISESIFSLWRNWAVGMGVLTLITMLSPIIQMKWLLLATLAAILFLKLYNKAMSTPDREVPHCTRNISQIIIILVTLAISLVPIYYLASREDVYEITGQPFSHNVPMLVILLIAPIAVVVTIVFLLNKREPLKCKQCKRCNGSALEHSFVGDLYRREWRYQTVVLLFLALALTVSDWAYYLCNYVNTNLNRADKFFFMWLPLVLYSLSLVYLGNRYYMMWVYYCKNDEGNLVKRNATTILRYLLLCGDKIFLQFKPTGKFTPSGNELKRYDTPVVEKVPYHETQNLAEAVTTFQRATGITNAQIRPIYDSPDHVTHQNMFHYFAFLDSPEDVENSKISGEWLTWGNVVQLDHNFMLERDFLSELRRIYDVVMTCKTYDKDGKRLYKIKNYRPTFRLRDLYNWNVDFNDANWLRVAYMNQDKFLYPLRRLFHKKVKEADGR